VDEARTLSGMMHASHQPARRRLLRKKRCPLHNGGNLQTQADVPGVITSCAMICAVIYAIPCSQSRGPSAGVGWQSGPCFRGTMLGATGRFVSLIAGRYLYLTGWAAVVYSKV
jgi:hypothetical protein